MFKVSPITAKRLKKFRSIKRGYYSFVALIVLIVLSMFAELFISNRALMVKYDDSYYFPTYGDIIPGTTFGETYEWETNYRKLKEKFDAEPEKGNFVIRHRIQDP